MKFWLSTVAAFTCLPLSLWLAPTSAGFFLLLAGLGAAACMVKFRSAGLAVLGLLVLPALVFAATNDMAALTPADLTDDAVPVNWFDGLIPLLAPALIALVKYFVPKIPKPMLPWIAPLFGAGVDWLGSAAGLSSGNPVMGALLGAAGVAVREALDQAKKGLSPSNAYSPLLLALLLPAVCLQTGCRSLDADGPYQGDETLHAADKTIVGAYDALHAFVKWEYQNRAALKDKPEITKAADTIRAGAEKWIASAIALRDVYAASPTSDNAVKLSTALRFLRQALDEAASYMAAPPKRAELSPPSRTLAAHFNAALKTKTSTQLI